MPCPHPIIEGGLCCVCGAHVALNSFENEEEDGGSGLVTDAEFSTRLVGSGDAGKVGETVLINEKAELLLALEHRKERRKKLESEDEGEVSDDGEGSSYAGDSVSRFNMYRDVMVNRRRLNLVLDLDHTLVHAINGDFSNLGKDFAKIMFQNCGNGGTSIHTLKFRPFLKDFLKSASEIGYDLTAYTAGVRSYAVSVCRAIEEYVGVGSIFGSRIVSRTDTPDICTFDDFGNMMCVNKSLKRIVGDGGGTSVILDDTEKVWCREWDESGFAGRREGEPPPNLLSIKAYDYWTKYGGVVNFREVNNSAGNSVGEESKIETEEIEKERHLMWSLKVLKRLHDAFYTAFDSGNKKVTVMNVMRTLRGTVLKGYRVVLSGVVPRHTLATPQQRNKSILPPRHDEIRYIEELGGRVFRDLANFGHRHSRIVTPRDRYRRRREVLIRGNKSESSDKNNGVRMLTGKEKEAEAKGVRIVNVNWLRTCWWKLEGEKWESQYEVGKEEEAYESSESEEIYQSDAEDRGGDKRVVEKSNKRKRENQRSDDDDVGDDEDDSSTDDDLLVQLEEGFSSGDEISQVVSLTGTEK